MTVVNNDGPTREPPIPFVDLSGEPDDERLSGISRVTVRLSLVRERWGEEYQTTPPPALSGFEVPIQHRDPAFLMPDKTLDVHTVKVIFGWIEYPRVVVLTNKTAWKGVVKPTPAQSLQVAESSILIGFDPHSFPLVIYPGESQPLLLNPNVTVYVRAGDHSPVLGIFAA